MNDGRKLIDLSLDKDAQIERIRKWYEKRKMRVPRRREILDRALAAGLPVEFAEQLGNGR